MSPFRSAKPSSVTTPFTRSNDQIRHSDSCDEDSQFKTYGIVGTSVITVIDRNVAPQNLHTASVRVLHAASQCGFYPFQIGALATMWYGEFAPGWVQTSGQVACCAYNSDELLPTARSPIRLRLLGARATRLAQGSAPRPRRSHRVCRSVP